MSGITLGQLAQVETEPVKKGILMNLIREFSVMEVLPFQSVSSLRNVAIRWGKLPTGGTWRKLNEGYTAAQEGTVEPVEESLFGFGGEITYDRVIGKITNTIVDPIVLQTEMKLKAISIGLKNAFINGDHLTDEDSIEGLKKRVSNLPARQTVYFASSTSAGLDVTASAANARTFVNKLDEMWEYCLGGKVDAIFCNEKFKIGIKKAFNYLQSAGNYFDVTKDMLGRKYLTYNGATLYDMGYDTDQSTEIITNTETGGTGSSNTTSIYMASFDQTEGLNGMQLEPLQAYDPLNGAESASTPSKMLRIDWWMGLVLFGSHGLVRGRNLLAPSSWTE